MSPGPYSGLTGPIPRDPTTGAVLISSQADGERRAFMPAGAIAETFSRQNINLGTAALASGALKLTAIYLQAGQVASGIGYISGGTAAVTPTHQWFALYTSALVLCRQTVNDLTTAWAALTLKALALTAPFTVPSSGLYYVGAMVAAATPPSILSATSNAAAQAVAPILHGNSASAGLTATAPDPAGAITANVNPLYAYVS